MNTKTPELTPTSVKLDKIIRRIEEGDIRIPAFQRGYVWKQNQIIELLSSIVNEYPIGSILLWKSSEKLNYTRDIAGYKIPARGPDYPVNYVLDGQQRIPSIYAVFSQLAEQNPETESYNPDLNLFEIYYDFSEKNFLPKQELPEDTSSCVYLRDLLEITKFLDAVKALDEKYHKDAQNLQSHFLNYELPVVTISNRKKEDVGIIFERINNTGTKLSILDLMTAWTWTEDFHLLDSSDKLLSELEDKKFGGLHPKLLLQIASGIIQQSTETKNIQGLTGEQIRDDWNKVCESIKKAVDFLSTEVKCRHLDFLPFHQQMIGISFFFSSKKNHTPEEIQFLKKWFWRTSFSNRYSTGQTTKKMDADISAINKMLNGDNSAIEKYSTNVIEDELVESKLSKSNRLTRAFLLLMAQLDPLDLATGTKVDLGQSLSIYSRKEYHHVFPDSFLKKQGHPLAKRFSLMNFCFLPANSNKKITNRSPSDYLFNITPKNIFTEIMTSNVLPITTNHYEQDDYDGFLKKRAAIVIQEIDKITA